MEGRRVLALWVAVALLAYEVDSAPGFENPFRILFQGRKSANEKKPEKDSNKEKAPIREEPETKEPLKKVDRESETNQSPELVYRRPETDSPPEEYDEPETYHPPQVELEESESSHPPQVEHKESEPNHPQREKHPELEPYHPQEGEYSEYEPDHSPPFEYDEPAREEAPLHHPSNEEYPLPPRHPPNERPSLPPFHPPMGDDSPFHPPMGDDSLFLPDHLDEDDIPEPHHPHPPVLFPSDFLPPFAPSNPFVRGEPFGSGRLQEPIPESCADRLGHAVFRGKNYYLSWEDPGFRSVNWAEGRDFCRRMCMEPVSLETAEENFFLGQRLADAHARGLTNLTWTSGRRCNFPACDHPDLRRTNGWYWTGSGAEIPRKGFGFTDWGTTGAGGREQPDDFFAPEDCLALAASEIHDEPSRRFTWHDVPCGFKEDIVCEDEPNLLDDVRRRQGIPLPF